VSRHEPSNALDGGGGLGLDCLVEVCAQAAVFLRPDGFLGIETGGELVCSHALQNSDIAFSFPVMTSNQKPESLMLLAMIDAVPMTKYGGIS